MLGRATTGSDGRLAPADADRERGCGDEHALDQHQRTEDDYPAGRASRPSEPVVARPSIEIRTQVHLASLRGRF